MNEVTDADIDTIVACMETLQEYLDTGLTPEQINKLKGVRNHDRKHERWVRGEVFGFYDCSECGYTVDWRGYKYCPHCGVMMEVDDETD